MDSNLTCSLDPSLRCKLPVPDNSTLKNQRESRNDISKLGNAQTYDMIWYGMVYGIWYMVYGIWYMVYGMISANRDLKEQNCANLVVFSKLANTGKRTTNSLS